MASAAVCIPPLLRGVPGDRDTLCVIGGDIAGDTLDARAVGWLVGHSGGSSLPATCAMSQRFASRSMSAWTRQEVE